jgi:RNA polymerase sigma factor (sigma-70 family)
MRYPRKRSESDVSAARPAGLDSHQFAELIEPHMQAMSRLAARIGPPGVEEDIVQEALVRAWRHRGRYQPARGSLANWLLAIVANEARRAAARPRLPYRLEAAATHTPIDEQLDIEVAIKRLPSRQRLAINCFYFADLSVEETAAVMSCSVGTVKSTLSDARQNLRQLLGVA